MNFKCDTMLSVTIEMVEVLSQIEDYAAKKQN